MNVALRARRALPIRSSVCIQPSPWRGGVSTSPLRSSPPPRRSAATLVAGVSEDDIHFARAHCSDLLRRFDAPSHTLAAFIPSSARDAHLALRALNVDTASVADATSNPSVAALRMQFWRDAVASALQPGVPPRKEPSIILLAHANATAPLSPAWLQRLLSARAARLTNPPFTDLAALETYAEHTYSTLLYLTLQSLPLASLAADHVASHIGKAQGIAAVLRGLPLLAFPSQAGGATHNASTAGLTAPTSPPAVTLPLTIMADAGVREEDVLRHGAAAHGLRDAVFAVATRASDHLITAREMLRELRAGRDAGHAFEHAEERLESLSLHQEGQGHHRPAATGAAKPATQAQEIDAAFGAFMPAISTQLWLDRLQAVDFDVFDPSLRGGAGMWKLPWRAYWAFTSRRL